MSDTFEIELDSTNKSIKWIIWLNENLIEYQTDEVETFTPVELNCIGLRRALGYLTERFRIARNDLIKISCDDAATRTAIENKSCTLIFSELEKIKDLGTRVVVGKIDIYSDVSSLDKTL